MKTFIFVFICFLLFSVKVFAQVDPTSTETATPILSLSPVSSVSSSAKEVNYFLPYPGLLPDSPLYFLKAFRDRFIGFMISNTEKKAEFNLLQADKRLNASVYLLKEGTGKDQLIISTLSKGENYFEEAIAAANEAKTQGMDTTNISRKLQMAVLKHEEVVGSLATQV